MGLTSPRVSGILAVLILIIYVVMITGGGEDNDLADNSEFQLMFLLILGGLIGMAAFNFAAKELKETDGVNSVTELGLTKFAGISLFAILIAVGYDSLIMILIEVFTEDDDPSDLSIWLVRAIVVVLLVYPFFQFLFLARPGEDSSIPAEYITEKIMETLREAIRSPLVATIIVYSITYLIPIGVLIAFWDISFITALLLWALVLPLISLGALAGAGIGEDLIRLRLIRNPATDWAKLGWPKLRLSPSNFEAEIGGFLLVLFAVQAIITTTIFGLLSLLTALGVWEASYAALGVQALLLALFNKGRGSTKEMSEVWQEGGFKVSTFQLFLPVYVFLGVILSSALEVFVTQDPDNPFGALAEMGLTDHIKLASGMLAIQNFVLIFTAIYIFRKPPGTAERRMIKEVPKFYGDDIKGYLWIYKKLKSDRSVENLLRELARYIRKYPEQASLLKGLLKETLTTGSARVQTAASETIFTIVKRLDGFDQDYHDLIIIALNSEYTGARIYAVRSMRLSLGWLEGIDKEEAIMIFQDKMKDPDPVISWDTSIALQRIVLDEPEYRSFILALMIKTLTKTNHEGTITAINRFLNRISKENTEVGHMAISILGVQLSSGDSENIESIIAGIRSIIRANPFLASDLIDVISMGIESNDEQSRIDSYLVLTNLAEYGSGQEEEILQLILRGVNDASIEIQKISYNALAKDVKNHPEMLEEVFSVLVSKFSELRGDALLGALGVIKAIVQLNQGLENQVFDLIKGASNSSTPAVRASVFEIMANLARSTSLADDIYLITETNLKHEDEYVREKAVAALGEAVIGNNELARSVYRKINDSRNDEVARVQLAAVEALGHVASASRQFSDEIFESLQPLLADNDWQVRLAALNGLFAASQERPDLADNLMKEMLFALTDNDRTIRERALDILIFVVDKYRKTSEMILASITKDLKAFSDDVKATLYNALQIIADRMGRQVEFILPLLGSAYENDEILVRIAVNETLTTCVEQLAKSRDRGSDVQKILNKLITDLQKAANHSSPAIRKTAYEGITIICAGLPDHKVSKRGRTAINRAIKHEKDVGLADFLENCRIRAVPPLDF